MACKKCGYSLRTYAHWDRCVSREPAFFRCSVPGCGIYTRTPNKYGMCPVDLWDLKHDAFYRQEARESA